MTTKKSLPGVWIQSMRTLACSSREWLSHCTKALTKNLAADCFPNVQAHLSDVGVIDR